MITLEIPRVPPSPNYLLGKHWRHRHRNSQVWRQEVWVALHQAGYSQRTPYPKARVSIDRRAHRELDPDNLVGCMKPVIDALRYADVLVDDTSDHIELVVTQTLDRKLNPRTLIEIEPLTA